MQFGELVGRVTMGQLPYAYQRRLANEGLPNLLRAPTGTGKTMAAVLPWLYRRRHHPDPEVRRATPRRLVFVLPQRTLVEQTIEVIEGWCERLGEVDLDRYVLMGGVDRDDWCWTTQPQRDAIFVGTQDMVLSRLLMRGYAEPRFRRPMSFGLLHADTQFVFDEVQLMGPGLPTSLQLHGLRAAIGTAAPCRSMWMSATLDVERLGGLTPDFNETPTVVGLSAEDRAGPLRARLEATRTVHRIDVDAKQYERELAGRVIDEHTAGTRTLVVLNTVDQAVKVFDILAKRKPGARLVLLHSRFRPADRRAHTASATADPPPAGVIVVSTQVLEAGVDITSELLVTELAPWSSIVQRAGRCNRDGRAAHARLLWVSPPQPLPYDAERLAHSADVLEMLEGAAVTSTQLQDAAEDLDPPVHPVLRRRDLIDLFDTTPDLDGNDVDVTQWIRDTDDRTVSLAWREVATLDRDAPFPGREELCAVPLRPVTDLLAQRPAQAQVYDQRGGGWRSADRSDVRPGAVIVFDAAVGGYLPDHGFAPRSTQPVSMSLPRKAPPVEANATDPLSHAGQWIALDRHLADVERETGMLIEALAPPGLTDNQRDAARLAGRYHDLGKAHKTFDDFLRRSSGDPGGEGPWAKSPGRGQLRHQPPYFRHELVSALLLLDPTTGLLEDVAEADLIVHLVLAHHGKVRLSVRGKPDEREGRVLGVKDGEFTLAARLPDGTTVPPTALSLTATKMGRDGLTARALRLRDRADLGVFRVAYLEALVRAADWIASASYEVSDQ